MVVPAGEGAAGRTNSEETTAEVVEAGAVTAKTEKTGSTFDRAVRVAREVVVADT